MPERLRKLPKLPELSKLLARRGGQALLLLGGAFVFADVVWGACRYDVFIDRTPAAPEAAVFAATVDRTSPDWAAFEAKLPEQARQALVSGGGLKDPTIFAVPGQDGALEWGLIEALSVATDRTGRTRVRMMPKGTAAVGFVVIEGRNVPFKARVGRGLVQAEVGRAFRGLHLETNPFTDARRLTAPIHEQAAYLEKPAEASWDRPIGLLGAQMQRFQALAGLLNLPGRVELAVSALETDGLHPFVLYYRPKHGGDLAGPVLEGYAKALLAEVDPVGFGVAMPDDTQLVELRREPDAIQTVRKSVNHFGERAQMAAPGGSHTMEIFYADDGEAWLSDDLDLIQASIMGSISSANPSGACETGGAGGFAALSAKKLESWPFFKNLERLTFSIHSLESGLFTICGYFAP